MVMASRFSAAPALSRQKVGSCGAFVPLTGPSQRADAAERVGRLASLPENKRGEGSTRVLLDKQSYTECMMWLACEDVVVDEPMLRHWTGAGPITAAQDVSPAEYEFLAQILQLDGLPQLRAQCVGGVLVLAKERRFKVMPNGPHSTPVSVSLLGARTMFDLYYEVQRVLKWNNKAEIELIESQTTLVLPRSQEDIIANHFSEDRDVIFLIAKEKVVEIPPLPPQPLDSRSLLSNNYDESEHAALALNTMGSMLPRCDFEKRLDESSPQDLLFSEPAVFEKGIVGLKNLGNTCFMNAGLQCLAHLDAVKSFVDSRVSTTTFGQSFLDLWVDLVKTLWGTDASLAPYSFKSLVDGFGLFRINQQHDCSEFLTVILDKLNEFVRVKPALPVKADFSTCEAAQRTYRHCNDSFVTETFSFIMRSDLECPACGAVSSNFDPSTSLSLNVPPPPPEDVEVFVILRQKAYSMRVRVAFETTVADLREKVCELFGPVRVVTGLMGSVTEGLLEWLDNSALLYDARHQIYCFCFENSSETDDVAAIYVRLRCPAEGDQQKSTTLIGYPLVFAVPPSAPVSICWDVERLSVQLARHVESWFRPLPRDLELAEHRREVAEELDLGVATNSGCPSSPKRARTSEQGPPRMQIALLPTADPPWSDFWMNYRIGFSMVYRSDNEFAPEQILVYPVDQPPFDPIPITDTTLEACLRNFSVGETLSEKDLWNCKSCGKSTCAKKTVSMETGPKVLMVQLKRFDAVNRKISTMVQFSVYKPIFVKNRSYSLVSVVNHIGTTIACGHYTAHIKIGTDWYVFNDHLVEKLASPELVVSDNAYILFFQAND